ncbi:MAG: hypothetical protein ACFFCD_13600 [Promethearchaeota archaeon]
MEKNFVTVKGKTYYVNKNGALDLSDKKITAIAEIEGLEYLTNLQWLSLEYTHIKEISERGMHK